MRQELIERLDRYRVRVLVAVIALVPIVFLRTEFDPFNVVKLAVLFTGVAISAGLTVMRLVQGASWRGLTRMVVPAGVFLGAVVVSWLFSDYRGWALIGQYSRFQGLLPYLAVIVLGILVADAFVGRVAVLAWAIVISAAVVAGYGCLQYLGVDPFSWSAYGVEIEAASSTLGNTQFTGGFLSIALPLAVALVWFDGSRRSWAMGATAVIVAGWILSFSQGALSAGMAALFIVAGYAAARRHRLAPRLGAILSALVALAVIAIVVVGIAKPNSDLIPETIRFRGDWWQQAARMGAASPLVGTGPNTFVLEGVHYRSLEDALGLGLTYTDDPHSVPLAHFANLGGLGAAAFVFVAVWFIRRRGKTPSALAVGFLGAGVAYFVQSLSSIDEPTLRVYMWVAVGGLVASTSVVEAGRRPPLSSGKSRKARARHVRDPVRHLWAVVLAGLVPVLVAWWSASYLVADARFSDAIRLLNEGKLDDAHLRYEQAVGFRPDPEYRRTYGGSLGDLLVQVGKRAEPIFTRVDDAFGYVDSLPDELGLVQYAGLLQAWAPVDPTALERSAGLYRQAIELDPINPALRLQLSLIYLEQERYEDVIRVLEPATPEGAEGMPSIWGALALAEANLGEREQALDHAQRALAADSSDPRASAALGLLNDGG